MGELQQVTNLFDVTTDCKVTELFCIIDEFCKHFDAENAGNLLEDNSGVKRRRRAASLSDSETINDMLKNTAQIVHSRHFCFEICFEKRVRTMVFVLKSAYKTIVMRFIRFLIVRLL